MHCITNDATNASRPCTTPGAHTADCDGETCTGCQPREAVFGLLCGNCQRKLTDVMVEWELFATELTGVDCAVTPERDGNTAKPGATIPLPATWLALDECRSYLTEYKGNVEQWVSTEAGALAALKFIRVARVAFVQHPIAEKPHRVNGFRCGECGWMRLTWNPPTFAGDKVRLICSNPDCGHEIGQSAFELVAKAAEATNER